MTIYTPAVPQANQQIAATQPIIEANFQYLPVMLGVDHSFTNNTSTAGDGFHKQITMANQADIVALPAGADTATYSNGGNLFMWNGVKNPVSGVIVSNTVTLTTTPSTLATLPAECVGYLFLTTATGVGISYTFITSAGAGYVQNFAFYANSTSLKFIPSFVGLDLKARYALGASASTTYKIIYWPV